MGTMLNITFAHPWVLLGLLMVPVMVGWWLWKYRKQEAALQHSSISLFAGLPKSWRQRLRWLPYALRTVAVALLIVALARPQSETSREETTVEGIDIVVTTDVSTSMLAEDFKPNRLEAAKQVASDFIDGCKNDRIGLVVFAKEAYTKVPLTVDHQVLKEQIQDLSLNNLPDGTALGDGTATAINHIKDSKAKSKAIILLTDGENNQGSVDPMVAAEIAEMYGIRLYTIGIGTEGTAPYPIQNMFGMPTYIYTEVNIDEDLLKQMAAKTTGGRYFRATDKQALEEIFGQIDQMEKSQIDVTQFTKKKDEFMPLLWLALIALGLEAVVRWGWMKN